MLGVRLCYIAVSQLTPALGVVRRRQEQVVERVELVGREQPFVLLPVVVVGPTEVAEAVLHTALGGR